MYYIRVALLEVRYADGSNNVLINSSQINCGGKENVVGIPNDIFLCRDYLA